MRRLRAALLLAVVALSVVAAGAVAPGAMAQDEEDELVHEDSLNASEHLTDPFGADISPDGEHLYVVESGEVHQFDLAEPNNLSTATYVGSKTVTNGVGETDIEWTPDGSRFILSDQGEYGIYVYDVDEAWNVSTASYTDELDTSDDMSYYIHFSVNFDGTGDTLYIKGGNTIWQYDLPAPYDVPNGSYAGEAAENVDGDFMDWNYDGQEMLQTGGDIIYRNHLSTQYDPASRELISETNVSSEASDLWGIAANGDDVFVVSDDLYLHQYRVLHSDPSLSNPRPEDDASFSENDVDLRVDVDDGDFPHDSVTVEFYDTDDGTLLGTDTLSDAGTATVTVSATGATTWNATAEDNAGFTDSTAPRTFHTPEAFEVRNETTNGLVDDREVTVEFFPRAEDGAIVERTTTDGTVSMAGLETDLEYIATISTNGYTERRTLVPDITEPQRGYLLHENQSQVQVRFTLDDQSGRYESDAKLRIQRAINESGTRTWHTVAGDEFGPAGVTVFLQQDQRYRLVIANDRGDQRVLGAFTATAAETVPLEVGSVEAVIDPTDRYWRWDAAYENTTTGQQVRFELRDEREETDRIYLEIYERGNPDNVLLENTTFDGPYGEFVYVEPVPDAENDTNWLVRATVERGDDTERVTDVVGPRPRDIGEGLPPWVQHLIGLGVPLLLMALSSQLNGAIGGIVGAGSAAMFWYIGFLDGVVGFGVMVLALLSAGMFYLRTNNGGGL